MRSLFLKVFAGYILVFLVLIIFIAVPTYRAVRSHYLDTLTEDLTKTAIGLKPHLIDMMHTPGTADLDRAVKDLGREMEIRITVIDSSGVVLADSERDPSSMENHGTRTEVMQARKDRVGVAMRYSTTVREEMLYVAIPIRGEEHVRGTLRVSLYLRMVNRLLGRLRTTIFSIAIIVIVCSLPVVVLLSRSLAKPIRELTDVSQRVASGDFDARVLLRGKGELRKLGDSFNDMASRLGHLFADVGSEREKLRAILSSLEEGLLLVDGDGRVVMLNDSFCRMIEGSSVEGKFYWEILREPGFGELMRRAAGEKRSLVEEVILRNRVYMASVTPLVESPGETVVLFHDVTEMKNLDRIKRDFVVNVSHELRTPLTAIKGFTEALEEEEKGNARYIEIIKRHTDRLINVVNDLLSLSELEDQSRFVVERVDLEALLESILVMFEPKLKEKDLTVSLDVRSPQVSIEGDPYRLEQMFINLIDNAVKYTESGKIIISLRREGNELIIKVADTGIGIPEEHLNRILERFYVVDKGRSRRVGGTGLGLSIVKHIVLLHNGTIDVRSSVGVGTTFTVRLPID